VGGDITLKRDANQPLEPVLEQVVDELRTASPQRLIEDRLRDYEAGQLRSDADRTTGVELDW
jgi:hypothetical protein